MEQVPTNEKSAAQDEVERRNQIIAELATIEQNIAHIKQLLGENPGDAGLEQQLKSGEQFRKMGIGALHDLAKGPAPAQNLGDMGAAATSVDPAALAGDAEGKKFVDSQGFVHSDADAAQANEPENWRIPNQQ